jgi:hypothetical protein
MQQQRTHAVTFAAEIILSEFRRPGQKTGLNPFTALLLGKDLYMYTLSRSGALTRSRSGVFCLLAACILFFYSIWPLNILYRCRYAMIEYFFLLCSGRPSQQFQCFLSPDCINDMQLKRPHC